MTSSNDTYVTKEYFDLRMNMQEAIFDRKLSDTRAELKEDIATVRTDMADLRTELKGDIANVRKDMAELRTELKGDMADLREDMNKKFNEVRLEIAEVRSEVRSEMRELRAEINGLVHWNYWVLALVSIIIVVAPSIKSLVDAFADMIRDFTRNRRLKIQDTEK